MQRMRVNWFEYQAMPESVLEDYRIIFKAELMVARDQEINSTE